MHATQDVESLRGSTSYQHPGPDETFARSVSSDGNASAVFQRIMDRKRVVFTTPTDALRDFRCFMPALTVSATVEVTETA